MNQAIRTILIITALIPTGCLCGFFILLNWIKQEEKRAENNEQTKK